MKKILMLMVVLIAWLPFSAFTSVESGTVIYANGSVKEVVSVGYSQNDAVAIDKSFEDLHNAMQASANELKTFLTQVMSQKIQTSESLTIEQKAQYLENVTIETATGLIEQNTKGTLSVVITYNEKEIWKWFCEDVENLTVNTTINNFFTITYKTDTPVMLSTFTTEGQTKNVFNLTYDKLKLELSKTLRTDVSSILVPGYSYTYGTSNSRLHSNAQTIEKSSTGYVYHTWNCNFGEDETLSLWQTRANAIVWYCSALVLTVLFGVATLLVAKFKKQDKQS